MKMKKIATILVSAILTIAIAGCAVGNKVTTNYSRSTTIGQEMLDLQQAKDSGAISQEEYNKAKQQILNCSGPVKVECSYSTKDKADKD